MKARIVVTLKPGVLDPQGQAIGKALGGLGFSDVAQVRQGKVFDLEFSDEAQADDKKIHEMCQKLLVNGVIEDYEVLPGGTDTAPE